MQFTIDILPQPLWPGQLGLARCPGTASLLADPARTALGRDLATIREWGAVAVVTLNEEAELKWLGLSGLRQLVEVHQMDWWNCPIPDFCAPAGQFLRAWDSAGPEIIAALQSGDRVLLHCLAGLGRTGTIAAWLLMHQGMGAQQAINCVRRARPGSVQSEEQRAFLFEQERILDL